uniref:Uncharacterized protein n=1 Tax=Palpitomonas bilix TaxID=652834 RepID=A0A7S3DK33_9EUKA
MTKRKAGKVDGEGGGERETKAQMKRRKEREAEEKERQRREEDAAKAKPLAKDDNKVNLVELAKSLKAQKHGSTKGHNHPMFPKSSAVISPVTSPSKHINSSRGALHVDVAETGNSVRDAVRGQVARSLVGPCWWRKRESLRNLFPPTPEEAPIYANDLDKDVLLTQRVSNRSERRKQVGKERGEVKEAKAASLACTIETMLYSLCNSETTPQYKSSARFLSGILRSANGSWLRGYMVQEAIELDYVCKCVLENEPLTEDGWWQAWDKLEGRKDEVLPPQHLNNDEDEDEDNSGASMKLPLLPKAGRSLSSIIEKIERKKQIEEEEAKQKKSILKTLRTELSAIDSKMKAGESSSEDRLAALALLGEIEAFKMPTPSSASVDALEEAVDSEEVEGIGEGEDSNRKESQELEQFGSMLRQYLASADVLHLEDKKTGTETSWQAIAAVEEGVVEESSVPPFLTIVGKVKSEDIVRMWQAARLKKCCRRVDLLVPENDDPKQHVSGEGAAEQGGQKTGTETSWQAIAAVEEGVVEESSVPPFLTIVGKVKSEDIVRMWQAARLKKCCRRVDLLVPENDDPKQHVSGEGAAEQGGKCAQLLASLSSKGRGIYLGTVGDAECYFSAAAAAEREWEKEEFRRFHHLPSTSLEKHAMLWRISEREIAKEGDIDPAAEFDLPDVVLAEDLGVEVGREESRMFELFSTSFSNGRLRGFRCVLFWYRLFILPLADDAFPFQALPPAEAGKVYGSMVIPSVEENILAAGLSSLPPSAVPQGRLSCTEAEDFIRQSVAAAGKRVILTRIEADFDEIESAKLEDAGRQLFSWGKVLVLERQPHLDIYFCPVTPFLASLVKVGCGGEEKLRRTKAIVVIVASTHVPHSDSGGRSELDPFAPPPSNTVSPHLSMSGEQRFTEEEYDPFAYNP